MTVAARPANDLSGAADPVLIDLRTTPDVRAGTLLWDGPDLSTGWHRHPYHQVEYALEGIAEVETPTGHYLLPPQQAVWIPAGLPHCTQLREVRSVSVFLEPALVPDGGDRARVLAAAPLVREMLVYSTRWPIERADHDADADAFFDVLARLVVEWLDRELPLCLPIATDPTIARAMDHTQQHLDEVTAGDVGRAVGMSERTLRRHFVTTVGMTWRAYLHQSRVLRAMALLAERDRSVLDVALAVGFDSPSAFTRAFRRVTGESPSAYRRRFHRPATRRPGAHPRR